MPSRPPIRLFAGKSAVGMLSYLACAAQRLPVVYIPSAGDWVSAAKIGQGDAFFLRMLLEQNADIVQDDAELMDVFTPLMRLADERHQPLFSSPDPAFCEKAASTMQHLAIVLGRRPTFGVIVDEVQKITEAVERDNMAYFKEGWDGWQQWPGSAFVRLDNALRPRHSFGSCCCCFCESDLPLRQRQAWVRLA
jgi:hypothetical protein